MAKGEEASARAHAAHSVSPLRDKDFAEKIRANGLQVTATRVRVLRLMQDAEAPMSHNEVTDALRGEGWARSTLRQNLARLTKVGLLSRFSFGGELRFELAKHAARRGGDLRDADRPWVPPDRS